MNVEILKSLLEYEQSSGIFRWKVYRGSMARAGDVAGGTDSKGYVQIKVNGRLYLAHRLAWLYVHGCFPAEHIDHIDRNPRNNALHNLRLCTHSQNHQNLGLRATNTSGTTGVSWVKRSKKWLAYVNVDGVRHRVGLFDDKEKAVSARLKAKADLHLFHPEQAFGLSAT